MTSHDGLDDLASLAGPSRLVDTHENFSSSSSTSISPIDDAIEVSAARNLYYPCTGNVDIKSYIDARMYGLSFRRLHDEWVVLGKPRIDTSHWPRLIGHRGLPSSPTDFVNVAEYYDRKIFGQVLLMEQGKSANADRPLDDFLVSMVTTAAVVNADFVVYRLVRNQPAVKEATAQSLWYHTFTTFLQDSVRHFVNERRVCDRLAAHQCITPLLFGQVHSMSYPTLLQAMHYQIQIFQNLFPNFGEHISRCAAAQPQQQWSPISNSTTLYTPVHVQATNPAASPSTSTNQGMSTAGAAHQYEMDSNRPLLVAIVPPEIEHRSDLFAASIDPAIRCDIPIERVASIIDSRSRASASTSASSASTPVSMKASAPILNTRTGSSFSSITSLPSSEADSQKRSRASQVSNDDDGTGIDSSNLILRPPLQSHTFSGETVGRAASEGYMITPDEVVTTSRSLSNPASSYFGSLPSTPTEGAASHLSPQDAAHPYVDRRPHRSNTTVTPMTSSSDPDSRKRSRAEQNREKMKAYHKRVMQQREALASVLADMTSHVGPVPFPLAGPGASVTGSKISSEDISIASSSRLTARNAQESSWSMAMRNKQKQESKARLRKREIDQVHELRLYASFAVVRMLRSSEASGSLYPKGSDKHTGSGDDWRATQAQQASEADKHTMHAIVRVFARNRSNWTALTSAEQRLTSEVAKLTLSEDEQRMLRGAGSNEVIKTLVDRIQVGERDGTLLLAEHSTPTLGVTSAYDHRGSGGSSSSSSYLTSGGTVIRATHLQQYARHSDFSPSLIHPGSLIISPESSSYGAAVSPSGVTRPAGSEDGGDYFAVERKRHASRYPDGSEPMPSVLSSAVSPGYTGHASVNFPRSPVPASMMSPPSVLSTGYGNNAFYASNQQRTGMDRHTQASMGGSQVQSTPLVENAHLRMSTSDDGRSYGQGLWEAGSGSRAEQGSGIYHPQPLQSFGYPSGMTTQGGGQGEGQQVYGLHAPDSTSTIQQYRTSPEGSSQHTQSYQQVQYNQQGPYGGQ